MIKHAGHLKNTAHVFYISRVFSSVRGVLSHCNRRLRLLHLLYDAEVTWRKTVKRAFSVLYSDKTWVLDQSERVQGPIYIITVNESQLEIFTNSGLT